MTKPTRTYADAGVSIDAGDELVRRIGPLARATNRPEIVGGIGGFASAMRLPRGLRDPLIVTTTDGVGTKLRLAFDLGRHDTVGIDLVAMSVNDLVSVGAEPIAFLDYFATGALDVDQAEQVVRGIAEGCRQAGCSLVGGETAEMPSFYAKGEYDVAGFAIGAVERKKLIDGRRIRRGDVLIGLPSDGLHSNGFSLVRAILRDRKIGLRKRVAALGRTAGEELLTPTRIYVRAILRLRDRVDLRGIVHVTGGGLVGNVPRVLPPGCRARIERGSWAVPAVFDWLADIGGIEQAEVDRAFNQGLGMVIVVPRGDADRALRSLRGGRIRASVIGDIVRGDPGVDFV